MTLAVGIEAMNAFGGTAALDVTALAQHRGLEMSRFENLLMKQRAVPLPFEDPVTLAVTAAKPLVDALSDEERGRIELLIIGTESGIDFGKSLGTYTHHYLGLSRNCRQFELKQACYSGTAALQMAVNFILSQASPGAKALVIATDMSRFMVADGGEALSQDWSYAEPSGGSGAVAVLVSETPHILRIDVGANGYYGYEVMDTCRPEPDSEAGDADLSLLSYLDCCENAFREYQRRVEGVDYRETFQYLAFHTPFGGMVKGAHRSMMRKLAKATPADIDTDFTRRVQPGLAYCARVGNIMGATVLLSLASTICNGDFSLPKRIGCFSYGSGCCSEFYSGVVGHDGAERLRKMGIAGQLDGRYLLSMEEYDSLLFSNSNLRFGTRNGTFNVSAFPQALASMRGKQRLVLSEIREFHRKYEWV
jgi:polyketide biosynthesis 3-hydroxy-3-methylglutaryl-CoA synthase-like enzyme PksG